jgi:uncharacterized protein YecA (UPF0149 family)
MIDCLGREFTPIEETDPEIAELVKDVCNRRYDRFNVKKIIFTDNDVILVPFKIIAIGRNDPCPCNSGLKFKKCKCEEYHHE